jgi:predicted SprT family Zn-dependent metalloprotease
MWQMLEAKAKAIEQVMSGKSNVREITEEANEYALIKAAASDNPLVKEKVEVDKEVRRLQNLKNSFIQQQYEAGKKAQNLPGTIASFEREIENIKTDIAGRPEKLNKDTFGVEIDGKSYSDKEEAWKAIKEKVNKIGVQDWAKDIPIGNYQGFTLEVSIIPPIGTTPKRVDLRIKGKSTYSASLSDSAIGTFASIDHAIYEMPERDLKTLQENVASEKKNLDKVNELTKGTFKHDADLQKNIARQIEVNRLLKKDTEGKKVQEEPPSSPSANSFAMTFGDTLPIEEGREYYQLKLKPAEVPELIRFAKLLSGRYPEIKAFLKAKGKFYPGSKLIKLHPELFEPGNEQKLALVLAHEIGHLVDYLPEGDLARGNLLGRLNQLHKYMKNTFGDSEITNKDIRAELLEITEYMHPYQGQQISENYRKYRESAKELYAEAISMLLVSPGTIERMAPNFTKMFFANIDNKLDVKEAYFDMLELLNGERSDVLEGLDKDIRRMFAKADPLRKQKITEKKVASISTFERLRQMVDNKYAPILKKIQNLEKQGVTLSPDKNPRYILEEYAMANNAVYDWVKRIDEKVKSKLDETGLSEIDLGVYTFLKRIIGAPAMEGEGIEGFDDVDKEQFGGMIDASTGKPYKEEFTDRKGIANPLGVNPARAEEQLTHFKKQIGDEKFSKIENIAKEFHALVFEVVQEAVRVGSYNKKVFAERIEPNKDTYVSFGVINYMQAYVPSGVKKQIGTLNEIENPFLTTILKTISLIKVNEKQRAANSVRDMLKENFADEIKDSKRIQRDRLVVFKDTPGFGRLQVLEDGRMASYDVDPYIAKSFDNDSAELSELMAKISKAMGNRIFKDLYITYNPGFAFAFNPIRDVKRTYKSLSALGHGVSVRQLLVEVAKALPESYRRLKGINNDTIQEMVNNRALDVPFDDFLADGYSDKDDNTYNALLQKYKLAKTNEEVKGIRRQLLKPIVKILEFMRFHGSALESVTKIAGYNILKSKDVYPAERAYITRNYIGTPNFRNKGTASDITNSVWMFSNIMKEGLKADIGLATGPKTRSGYWWATVKVDLFPKLLMMLASAGIFGLLLKKWFEKVPEYDKTNYIIIPLGEHKGKPVYARIPHDETGRLMAAMFWKIGGALQGKPEKLQEIFAFGAGQLPDVAPGIKLVTGWATYLSGQNPYDNFRGRNIINETEWKAGGWNSIKKMVQWTMNQTGQLNFATYDRSGNSTFETVVQVVPFINRLIKVSDFGSTEGLKQIRKETEQFKAQESLMKREEFKKGAEDFEKGENPLKILKGISEKVYPGEQIDKRKFGVLQKGLVRQILKTREDDPNVDALLYAASNEEKKRILFKMRDDLSLQEFKKKARLLRNLRVFSNEVMTPGEWQAILR